MHVPYLFSDVVVFGAKFRVHVPKLLVRFFKCPEVVGLAVEQVHAGNSDGLHVMLAQHDPVVVLTTLSSLEILGNEVDRDVLVSWCLTLLA